jgi:hypothetical protein
MDNMKNTTAVKLPDFVAELEQVLGDKHGLSLDGDCTGGISPLGDDEKFIGTVPPGMTRVLYLVSRYYDHISAEQKIAYEFSADGSKAEQVAMTLGTLAKERADVYRNMFWASVHDTYPPAKEYKGLSLRQGWGLVETPAEDTVLMSLLQLLKERR